MDCENLLPVILFLRSFFEIGIRDFAGVKGVNE